jgi:hypothetical protein
MLGTARQPLDRHAVALPYLVRAAIGILSSMRKWVVQHPELHHLQRDNVTNPKTVLERGQS